MIKNFKIFEQFREDDPYQEEDWFDENLIKIGDKLICVDDFDSGLKEDEEYTCVDITDDEGGQYLDVKDSRGKVFLFWEANRFKRI